MASIYAPFIYLLPFSLLIYLFLCGSSPLFLRLRSLSYNVSDKHFSSPDKSFVWRYLFCEIVLVTWSCALWRNAVAQKLKRTHIFASTTLSPPPHSPCFQRIQFLPSLPTAEKQENFFSETLLKSIFWHPKVFYFLIPLSQRTFHHTLPCSVIYCTVCVGKMKGEVWQWCGQWVKAKRIKRDPIITRRRSVVPLERTKWPLSPCLPYRDIIGFSGGNFLGPKLHLFCLLPELPCSAHPCSKESMRAPREIIPVVTC